MQEQSGGEKQRRERKVARRRHKVMRQQVEARLRALEEEESEEEFENWVRKREQAERRGLKVKPVFVFKAREAQVDLCMHPGCVLNIEHVQYGLCGVLIWLIIMAVASR